MTAYDMRISDWSSDVCSSDLSGRMTGSSIFSRCVRNIGKADLTLAREERGAAIVEMALVLPLPLALLMGVLVYGQRSEERRDGQECVSTVIYRWESSTQKKKEHKVHQDNLILTKEKNM